MSNFNAEYHIKNGWTGEIIKIMAITALSAAREFFKMTPYVYHVEVKVLGGTEWQKIHRT